MTTKQELFDWHKKQLGFVEGPNNSTPYSEIAGHAPNLAWCASYQVAGAVQTGLELPPGASSAYTPAMFNAFKKADLVLDRPEPGAFGFLYYPTLRRIGHVVLVEELRPDGRFVTFEGNTDVAGGRTGGRVMRKVRSVAGFSFAMPVYSEAPAPQPPAQHPGVDRELTKRIQRAVDVPADGLWGNHTDSRAVRMRSASQSKLGWPMRTNVAFNVADVQTVVGTKVDGDWGPKSQAALARWLVQFQSILGVGADGRWGPRTEARFMQVRNDNLKKF